MTKENNTIENEVQEQEVKMIAEITIQLMEDGTINLNAGDDDMEVLVMENMLKKSYETIHEQRIIQMALNAFKQKLS